MKAQEPARAHTRTQKLKYNKANSTGLKCRSGIFLNTFLFGKYSQTLLNFEGAGTFNVCMIVCVCVCVS